MKPEFSPYYNCPEFHCDRFNDTKRSAEKIVCFLNRLVRPSSVCDVGCGIGVFLDTFKKTGCQTVLGIDMDWVDAKKLVIDSGEFLKKDLTKSFFLSRRFDICICLEVAEHLPEACADNFIDSLCRLSDLILFSAAIPQQGGFCHVNEQWQSYWANKFLSQGYIPYDQVRKAIWDKQDIHWWYRQNIILFTKKNADVLSQILRSWEPVTEISCLDVVHPDCWANAKNLSSSHVFLKRIKSRLLNFIAKLIGLISALFLYK